ncbi:unnamed protein product [Rhodiola kirilowii]
MFLYSLFRLTSPRLHSAYKKHAAEQSLCKHELPTFFNNLLSRDIRPSPAKIPTMQFLTPAISGAPITPPILFTCSVFLLLFLLNFNGVDAQSKLLTSHWKSAAATWYGEPDGDGSSGGACGYGSLVDVKPLKARVGAVSPILFKNGEGCGACYKVKCLDRSICSRKPVTVIITDECPGCSAGRTQFDLSGAAFTRMAVSRRLGPSLRNRGEISILFRRTACKYPGKNVAFHVNEGSTDHWLALLVEFEDADGDVGSMHLKQANSQEWLQMRHLWGANWCLNQGPLVGPFSVKITTLSTNRTLSARDVIPRNWSPKATYTSRLNFKLKK